jgi:hypothetical protein
MAPGFRFFDFEPGPCHELPALITTLVEEASKTVGSIDGVVLPELAISDSDYEPLSHAALASCKFLVCGVKSKGAASFARNEVKFRVVFRGKTAAASDHGVFADIGPQAKHHRWLLEENQIVQYGLGGGLTPTLKWWENIELGPRLVHFVALEDWLSTCVLVCEDLARQDPVAEIVRAVGPNLVIALLMDGPQLASRWAARYATVLADDPGSSVLTLTSLGMAELSRPPGKDPSRVVGLWKDALRAEPVEIVLPKDHQAVVLSLSVRYREEFTADGRSDHGNTGFPTLSGQHAIALPPGRLT